MIGYWVTLGIICGMVIHGNSVSWHIKTRLDPGPVTADLTTTDQHSNNLLINDVKPIHVLFY